MYSDGLSGLGKLICSIVRMIWVTRLGYFSTIGLILNAHYDFLKNEVDQKIGDILATFYKCIIGMFLPK
jgi:hypothetical protein